MSNLLGHRVEKPDVAGHIRKNPEDFEVVEELGFAPSGTGEHVFLRVRKRAANTDWVAGRIAAFAKVSRSAVGYAGLKDRHAVAEQWFSVHLPGTQEPHWMDCQDAEFSIIEHTRHSRKLRRGALKGNAFRITIRGFTGEVMALKESLDRITAQGVPNYFGEQRFGREGGNLAGAEALFLGHQRIKDRHRRGLYLSTARAYLFNQVLSRRVLQGSWNQALAGDIMMLEGSHSIFPLESADDPAIHRRMASLDIHPTGPLWGRGPLSSRDEALSQEQAVESLFPVLCRGLEQAGLKQERRALRLGVVDASLETIADDVVTVHFRLPAGAYATAVLRELIACSRTTA